MALPHWPTRALLRRPSPAYAAAYAQRGVVIDQSRAELQHAKYAAALRACGLETRVLEADPARFDSVFVEDTAVVWGRRALMTRMTPAREGEQGEVEAFFGRTHEIVRLPRSALLEGGDVLHAQDATFVGLSSRTNEAGAVALRAFLGPARHVVRAPVERCLHLKTGATWLGDRTMLVAPSRVDPAVFEGFEVIEVAEEDANAANVMRLADVVMTTARRASTLRALRAFCTERSLRLVTLDIGEFEKGDGSLTCMSILW